MRTRLSHAGMAVGTVIASIMLQTASAQNTSPYWSLAGNSNATANSKLGTVNAIPLKLFTNNLTRVFIASTGNVGIGTTAPTYKLHVVGAANGIYGKGTSYGVVGAGGTYGLYGTGTYGVYGSGTYGLYGSGTSYGVVGAGGTYGVYGSGSSYGLYGYSSSNYGVFGSSGYTGVYGSGTTYGVIGAGGTYGVYGSGTSYGLYGYSSSNYGVYGNSGYLGVWGNGTTYGLYGTGGTYGLYAYSSASSGGYGVYGYNTGGDGTFGYNGGYGHGVGSYCENGSGVYGYSHNYVGVWGATGNSSSYAGYFAGNVYCTGSYLGSDKNLKQNIREFNSAMDIINKLKPREYEYRHDGNYDLMNLPDGSHYGLIAQDLEQVLPNLVKDTKFETNMGKKSFALKPGSTGDPDKNKSALTAPSTDEKAETINFKAVNYVELIPIMIKAMQEQQKQIDDLKNLVKSLSSTNQAPSAISSDEASTKTAAAGAFLQQNAPNPFSQSTTIRFTLPASAKQGQLAIYDMNGGMVKSFTVAGSQNQVTVDKGSLTSGNYMYSLIVDGKKVDTKTMVLTK